MSVNLISSIWRVSRTKRGPQTDVLMFIYRRILVHSCQSRNKKRYKIMKPPIWYDSISGRGWRIRSMDLRLGAAALVDLSSDESEFATIALINMGPREGWRRKRPVAWSPWDPVRLRNCAWWGRYQHVYEQTHGLWDAPPDRVQILARMVKGQSNRNASDLASRGERYCKTSRPQHCEEMPTSNLDPRYRSGKIRLIWKGDDARDLRDQARHGHVKRYHILQYS
jgi:hypothetical protein